MQLRLQECTVKKEELQDEVIKLNVKNADLERQLKSIDRKAKLLQSDKDFVVQTADTEMNVAKVKLLELKGPVKIPCFIFVLLYSNFSRQVSSSLLL